MSTGLILVSIITDLCFHHKQLQQVRQQVTLVEKKKKKSATAEECKRFYCIEGQISGTMSAVEQYSPHISQV